MSKKQRLIISTIIELMLVVGAWFVISNPRLFWGITLLCLAFSWRLHTRIKEGF